MTLDVAKLLREQGIATIPTSKDKVPRIQWKKYIHEVPTEEEITGWFSKGSNSIALVAGQIQCVDFDEKWAKGILSRFVARSKEVGLDHLLGELLRQRTQSGGYHLVFRCAGKPIGNMKLANRPATAEEKKESPHVKEFSMIETRGEGGYFLIAPSPGYVLEQGDWSSIPSISEDDRDALLSLARSFDERQPTEAHAPVASSPGSDVTPGDDYDARADVPALLRQHGWKAAGPSGKYWTRPGKTKGISASWDVIPRRMFVFSSSTEFQPQHVYRPWHIYAMLECGGDFSRAASELRRQGFGGKRAKPSAPLPWDDVIEDEPLGVEPCPDDPPGIEGVDPRGGEVIRLPSKVRPMTVWRPSQFFDFVPDPSGEMLGNGYIAAGEWTSLLGVGGLGKSRIALWLCICQMTGREWCCIPTNGTPKPALFLSTENGVARWKHDLERMWQALTEAERVIVEQNLRVLALTPEEEGDLNLGDRDNIARIVATLQEHNPSLIVLDPFADMIDGDENSTSDLVSTLRVLRAIHRQGAPEAAVLIIHHARTGSANVAQAGDNYSAGNFGRGSKALYSRVRCEMQLAPGDRSNSNLLVLACGKSNNAEKFAPRGVVFDPETFAYSVDAAFDINTWRADVVGQSKGQAVTVLQVVKVVAEKTGKTLEPISTGELAEAVKNVSGAGIRAVKNRLSEALEAGYLMQPRHGYYKLGPTPLKAA